MSEEPPLRIVSPLDHFGRVPETKLLFSDATDAECRLYAVLSTFDYRRDCEIYEGRKALVKATGWSLRKVADVLARLEERGAIRRERRGRGHPNSIYLLADLAPDDGQESAHQADDGQESPHDGQTPAISPLIEREKTRGSRRKPETSLPEGWRPSEATREWAKREYPEQANLAVLAAFRDYALAVDWRRRDWEATFRNWVRKEAGWTKTKAANQPARTYL